MISRPTWRRSVAILACTASLAGAATAVTPALAAAAPASAKATSCGSRTISVSAKGSKAVEVPVSLIRVEGGVTCKQAYVVIGGALTKELPPGWTVRTGKFKVPKGLIAQIAVKGSKTVKYATVGN